MQHLLDEATVSLTPPWRCKEARHWTYYSKKRSQLAESELLCAGTVFVLRTAEDKEKCRQL